RGRGKSGLHRAGCRVTPGRNSRGLAADVKARNRATETIRFLREAGETRQPPSGATPNRRTTTLLAESAGRRLEPIGNGGARGITGIARGEPRGVTEPGLSAGFAVHPDERVARVRRRSRLPASFRISRAAFR